MTAVSATIIADSLAPNGVRLTTFECLLPKCLLQDVNCHRVLSRNAASMAAIPTAKLIETIRNGGGYMPSRWFKNGKGMVADI